MSLPTADTLPPQAVSIPGPPPMPSNLGEYSTDPMELVTLERLGNRVANLSDQLNDPDGTLHSLFARLSRQSGEQHEELMRSITHLNQAVSHVSNAMVDLSARIAKLEPDVEEHGARLVLIEGSKQPGGQQQ